MRVANAGTLRGKVQTIQFTAGIWLFARGELQLPVSPRFTRGSLLSSKSWLLLHRKCTGKNWTRK